MSIDLNGAYRLAPEVAVRPEPFGALCYHYGNRRLTFLKSDEMVTVVTALADHESVAAALRATGIVERRWPSFVKALASLEQSEVVVARG